MPAIEPIDALQKVVAEHGLEWVFEQPEMVESLLLDYCERRSPQIHLLVSSLKQQVPQRLLSARRPSQREAVIGQARQDLATDLGIVPEKASWTVDAWLKILDSNGKSVPPLPLEEERKEPPAPIEKSYQEQCREIMKKAFDEGEPIHIVAKLLPEADERKATAMAKAYWAGLSEAERQAIKKTRRAKGYTWTSPKILLLILVSVAAIAAVSVVVPYVFVYVVFPAMGFALTFVRDAWDQVKSGHYIAGIPKLLLCAAVAYAILRLLGKRS